MQKLQCQRSVLVSIETDRRRTDNTDRFTLPVVGKILLQYMHDYCKLNDSQQLLGMSICVYSLIGVITLSEQCDCAIQTKTNLCSASSADNVALPAFAAAHRAAVRRPCSSRSISPARRAHSSKPVTAACGGRQTDRQTDRRPTVTETLFGILCRQRHREDHSASRIRRSDVVQCLRFFSLPRHGRGCGPKYLGPWSLTN